LLPRYIVKDGNGSVVGNGRVGAGKISLPPGRYDVLVGSDVESKSVEVVSGETADLRLDR